MPELPEVETVRRTLEPKILGRKIAGVEIFLPKIVRPMQPAEFTAAVSGGRIKTLNRRGKYLLIGLDIGVTLVVSLRMTGRLIFVPEGSTEPLHAHTHLVLTFEDESQLRFQDTRQFGTVHCVATAELASTPELAKLGPEPLSSEFSAAEMRSRLQRKKKTVKQVLLDQTFVAGIGNIYADEALFRAGIRPDRAADSLSVKETDSLYRAATGVLREAVEERGTSVRDYVDGEGNAGNFQNLLQVYGRKGEACGRCGTALVYTRIGGRSAHFCPTCQK